MGKFDPLFYTHTYPGTPHHVFLTDDGRTCLEVILVMMKNGKSLTIIQLNDSHAYFDPHQEIFWLGGQSVYRPAGGYARIASVVP